MEDMKKRGWTQADFVFVIGDAYVDHPSFGPAIISRLLERYGYKVCMIAQPDWKNDKSIDVFGRPRLGFLVCGGNMDSMVNHYSVSKKRRQKDAYSPGGQMGLRPDYATTVYCNLIRRTYKDVPIIIGGIEASLRRMAHYDYWSDKLKHSILVDSSADILSYGMGEHSMIEIAEALDSGIDVKDITFVRGTCYRTKDISGVPEDSIILPDYDSLSKDRLEYARSFYTQYINTDPYSAKTLVEGYGNRGYVVQNPPAYPLTQMEMDDVYDLPYMTHDPDFKGYIHDVGGPTANFRHKSCAKQDKYGVCTNKQCLFPEPCRNLKVDHKDYVELLRKLEAVPGVKKVFIRSGIRFDYVMADSNDEFLKELCEKHISGQLRVAPEHVSDNVLRMMGKPQNSVYEKFIDRYKRVNAKTGKQQYVVPYLMSSHPGSTLKEAVELAEYVRDIGYMPEQVQDFYPTPSTISTCMYYTGVDPRTMKPVYVPHNPHEKAMQKALMMYRKPENYDLVKEALIKAGRQDLIGFDKKCLIAPRKMDRKGEHQGQRSYGKNDKSKNNSINNGKNSKNNKVVPQKNTKSSGQKNAKNGKNRNKRK